MLRVLLGLRRQWGLQLAYLVMLAIPQLVLDFVSFARLDLLNLPEPLVLVSVTIVCDLFIFCC